MKTQNHVDVKYLVCLVAIFLLPLSASAQDRLVPSVYTTIQAAINAAENGDTVIIDDGTYTGPGNREIHFLGKQVTVQSANGPTNCIIDCGYAGAGFYFDNAETADSVLRGVAIKNSGQPGAVTTVDSSPLIDNCVITLGMGVNFTGGAPTITGCTISECYSASYGQGAIALTDCDGADIRDCLLMNNYIGAMIGFNSNASVSGCVFKFNYAMEGGAILWNGGALALSNSQITQNSAQGRDSNPDPGECPPGCDPACDPIMDPGCIPCDPGGCPPEPAGDGLGGGICCGYWGGTSALDIQNCLIAENSAYGGIAYMSPSGGAYGGGIYCNAETSLTISNSTIANNYASAWPDGPGCAGGGIFKDYSPGSLTTIENCIIWGNDVDENYQGLKDGPQIAGAAEFDITFSDVGPGQGWWPGNGNIYADPLFAAGPVGNFYLSAVEAGQDDTSTCINTGSSPSSNYGLDEFTTSTDNYPDFDTVDMGYHYEISEQQTLSLLNFNGGQTFIAGQTQTVTWDSVGAVRSVKVEYSTNNGAFWQETNPANYTNTGSFQWVIPAVDSNQCLLKITDRNFSTATDTSDNVFTIFICHLTADLTDDCEINLDDFIKLASEWMLSGNPFAGE